MWDGGLLGVFRGIMVFMRRVSGRDDLVMFTLPCFAIVYSLILSGGFGSRFCTVS